MCCLPIVRCEHSKSSRTPARASRRIGRVKSDNPMRLHRLILAILTISLLAAGNAVAHPLGNFSINQYSAIRIGKTEIELRYIVDMAEIPTFQEIQQTGLVPQAGDASATSYLLHRVETLRDGLSLEVKGPRN